MWKVVLSLVLSDVIVDFHLVGINELLFVEKLQELSASQSTSWEEAEVSQVEKH